MHSLQVQSVVSYVWLFWIHDTGTQQSSRMVSDTGRDQVIFSFLVVAILLPPPPICSYHLPIHRPDTDLELLAALFKTKKFEKKSSENLVYK